MSEEIPPEGALPAGGPKRGDIREDVAKQLALLFPHDRMERIAQRSGRGTSRTSSSSSTSSARRSRAASSSRAIEVTAQQIDLGQATASATPDIAHVDLP